MVNDCLAFRSYPFLTSGKMANLYPPRRLQKLKDNVFITKTLFSDIYMPVIGILLVLALPDSIRISKALEMFFDQFSDGIYCMSIQS